MNIYAQVMAGGIGKRMGNTPLPKQFLMLGSRPVIVHTVEKFILNDQFSRILVSTPEAWIDYTHEIFEKYQVVDSRIRVIAGGKERNDTLQKAIDYIDSTVGLADDDVIVCHDAVRPFVSRRVIDDNIEALQTYKAVDTVIPAYDTIVKADGRELEEIPVRDQMYQGQTPQSFNIREFQRALAALSAQDRAVLSDSCKIILLGGGKVGMVYGDVSNIKITTPYDLRIANAILATSHAASENAADQATD